MRYWVNFISYRNVTDNINTKSYWNKKYQETGPVWRVGHYRHLESLLPHDDPFSILEIGCGTGDGIVFLSESIQKGEYSACDFSETAIRMAESKNSDVRFYVFDVLKEEIAGVYDFILLIEILEHLDDPFAVVDKCLKSVRRAVIVMTPLNPSDYSGPVKGDFKSSEHRYAFSREAFAGRYHYELCKEFGDYVLFKILGKA
jgi:2-polyprenyl-3-methyl-5-hydroxy-6-metoxy-1,4-benzoquinol methylase